MPRWMYELWVLAFWWSTWTLADTYLIPYSPRSELAVLAACMATLALAAAWRAVPVCRRRVRKMESGLANVTQSHAGSQYGKQVDAAIL